MRKEQIKNRIIEAITSNNNQEITGPVLQDTLLAIIDDIYIDLDTIPEVAQSTGLSEKKVISQKITTEALNKVDKILPFDGFIDSANILNQSNPYEGGKIYYVISAKQFAYYREEDGIYTALWNGFDKYATIIAGQGVIPNSGVIFTFNNVFYRWSGEALTEITSNFVIVDDLTRTDAGAAQGVATSPKAVKDYVNEMTSLGYAFMGVASTGTSPKATDKKMCYIAIQNGDYIHFRLFGIKKYSLLLWDGSQWSVQNTDVLTQEGSIVEELGYNHDKVMSQASVTVEVKNVLEKFTWKSINE